MGVTRLNPSLGSGAFVQERMGYLLADGGLRVLHGAHHLEEVVVAALQRGRGGRRFGDANRGEPPAELVGIGHGGCGMRAGKDGHGGTRNPTCPAPALPRPALVGRLGGKGTGRRWTGLQACKGGRRSRAWRVERLQEVGGEEPKITSHTRNKIIRIIPFFKEKKATMFCLFFERKQCSVFRMAMFNNQAVLSREKSYNCNKIFRSVKKIYFKTAT